MSAKSSRPGRTLTDIRTLAGKSSDKSQRGYANYFEMGALELERLRRTQEREAAQRRINEIDRRIGEIDAEMRQLKAEVDVTNSARDPAGDVAPAQRGRPVARARATASPAAGGAVSVTRASVSGAEAPTARNGLRIRY
jgi:uncharacterized small protein (DUF1192 family)